MKIIEQHTKCGWSYRADNQCHLMNSTVWQRLRLRQRRRRCRDCNANSWGWWARKMRYNLYIRMSWNGWNMGWRGKGNKISLNQCVASNTLQWVLWRCVQHTTTHSVNIRMRVCVFGVIRYALIKKFRVICCMNKTLWYCIPIKSDSEHTKSQPNNNIKTNRKHASLKEPHSLILAVRRKGREKKIVQYTHTTHIWYETDFHFRTCATQSN